jgi:hypothetical protein
VIIKLTGAIDEPTALVEEDIIDADYSALVPSGLVIPLQQFQSLGV